jgi:hypothetical protein
MRQPLLSWGLPFSTKSLTMKYLIVLLTLYLSSCAKEIVPQGRHGVKIISWDEDADGLITASWKYPDGRVGGTDWTEEKWIHVLIDEQRYWPECADEECTWVCWPEIREKNGGKCWRHFPIPELESIDKSLTNPL